MVNLLPNSIIGDFSGEVLYKSIKTGDTFLKVNYRNGQSYVSKQTQGNSSRYECYPDEAGKLECVVDWRVAYPNRIRVYATINPRTKKKEWVTKDGEPVLNIEIKCRIDKDFSSCYLTYFNTQGYSTFPNFYGGRVNGTIVKRNHIPVNEPIDLCESNPCAGGSLCLSYDKEECEAVAIEKWEAQIDDSQLRPCMKALLTKYIF